MALEGFSGIWGLVITNPVLSDDVSQGDDHLRGIKQSIKNTFPLVSATSNMTMQAAYGMMLLANSSTEFSASTSLSLFTGFDTPGLSTNTTLRTASGAIIVTYAGDYEAYAQFSISASTAANITVALYVNDTDTALRASTLVPAQGRASLSVGGAVSMTASQELKTRLLATTSKLITVKDAQLLIRKLN